MCRSKINPFDCQETMPYRADPEIRVMTGLIDSATHNDIDTFERILRENETYVHTRTRTRTHTHTHVGPLCRTL